MVYFSDNLTKITLFFSATCRSPLHARSDHPAARRAPPARRQRRRVGRVAAAVDPAAVVRTVTNE